MRFALAPKLIAVTLAALLSGCSMHPLGISDDEWAQMSQDQRMQAYHEQATLDKAEQAARLREAELRAEEERHQREILELRRQQARPGDLVQCVIEPLARKQGKGWKPVQGVAFELVRGESQRVMLQDIEGRSQRSAWAVFSPSGQTIALCGYESDTDDLNDCARLNVTSRELARGTHQRLERNRHFEGEIRCDLPLRLRR